MSQRGRQSFVLLDDVIVNTNGPVIELQAFNDILYGTVQVDIVGSSATVTIEGRMSPLMPWVVLETFTAPGATRITPFPEMRAVSSAMSSATVRVEASF